MLHRGRWHTLVWTNAALGDRRGQLDALMAYLTESGIQFMHINAGDEPLGTILRRISKQPAARYLDGREGVEVVADIRAGDVG